MIVPEQFEDDRETFEAGWPETNGSEREKPVPFPWPALGATCTLVLFHLALVFWMWSPLPPGRELLRWGGLVRGAVLDEPWRILSSLALHTSPSHALWNGVSMSVFGVPLIAERGLLRVLGIYVCSGIGGAMAALAFALPEVYVVGSSGAVAGLFGAWLVLRLGEPRDPLLGWRTTVRVVGIGLLVIPSLVSPVTSGGEPVSVGSHLGGMATGMAIGALLSLRRVAQSRSRSGPS